MFNLDTRNAIAKKLRRENYTPDQAWSLYKLVRNWVIVFVLSIEATVIVVAVLSH